MKIEGPSSSKIIGAILHLAVGAFLAGPAVATSIDFNDGNSGQGISSFYANQGLTFLNASWQGPSANQAGTPSDGLVLADLTDDGFNPPFSPTASTPIVGIFSTPVTLVSILAVDIGVAGVRLDAYDAIAGGNVVATDSFFGVGPGVGAFHTLSVSAPGILRFQLYQPNPTLGDGVAFDNLVYSAVPELGSAILFGVGSLFAIAYRKRG